MKPLVKIFLVLFLFCGLGAQVHAKTPGEVEEGGMLRDVQMNGLLGKSAKFSDFRGKPLIINVWASWCGPCRDEMASLERLHKKSGGKHFNVIGVSVDDYVEKASAAVKESRLSFRNFLDHQLILEHMLGADTIPLTVLVDAKGRVLAKVRGSRQWDSPDALQAIQDVFQIRM